MTATPEAAHAPPTGFLGRLKALKHRHEKLFEVCFFAAGFCFDLLLLHRIDSVPMLIHQGSYLFLLTVLLTVDHNYTVKGKDPKGFMGKVLGFRHWVIHFFFGTLLNAFVVFYFKASSGFLAFGFLVVLCAVLLANELPRFRKLGPIMRIALLSFVVTSYFSYVLPVMAGFLSPFLFIGAVLASSVVIYYLWRVQTRFTHDPAWTFQRAVLPGFAINGVLLALYFLAVVPPVPLSLKWIGIYHDVQKDGKDVRLSHMRPPWKLWEHGDQEFLARPGDRVYVFMRIFAPRKFRDHLKVRWAWYNPKVGWMPTDAIPLVISGGSEEGWWAKAYKENYTPGEYKVDIETDDGRSIGNIKLNIIEDLTTEPREFREDVR
jgi:hypothetical protein